MLLAEYDYETDIAVQREEAREEGENVMAVLTEKLLTEGRIEECKKAMRDKKYRKHLIQELNVQAR